MVTMPPKGRPGRPRSEESREAILKAATELMLEVGPRRMTVDQIALRSGVSRTTLTHALKHSSEDKLPPEQGPLASTVPVDKPGIHGAARLPLVVLVQCLQRSPSE